MPRQVGDKPNAQHEPSRPDATDGFAPRAERRPSPIIEELRVAGDEVQLTRVLGAVCSSSHEVGRAFVQAVLGAAARNAEIGERATKLQVPPSISCTPGLGLARAGRGIVARQKRILGTGDLSFRATQPFFHLICELKINAPYRSGQIEDYLQTGAYVVSIVRKPKQLPSTVVAADRWLGEVTWKDLRGDLRQLPLAEVDRQVWLDLLDVIEADGDFEPVAPKRSTPQDRELVEAVVRGVTEKLRRAVRRRPNGAALASALRIRTGGIRRIGAWARIEDGSGQILFLVGARDARLRTPEIIVEWFPPKGMTGAAQHEMRAELESKHHFRRRRRGGFRFHEAVVVGSGDQVGAATETAWKAICAIVSPGLLDYNIGTFARD